MRKLFLVLGAAALLAGCGGRGELATGITPAKVEAKVEKVGARFDAVRPMAVLLCANEDVSPTLAKVCTALRIADQALAIARVTSSAAAAAAEAKRAEKAVETLESTVGPAPS